MELIAIQLTSTPDIEQNLAQVEVQLKQITELSLSGPVLVVLPECFALFGGAAGLNLQHQETLGNGPIQARLAALAKTYQVWLVGGTIPTRTTRANKFYATTTVFNPAGELVADYQKIHLFDVDIADNTRQYRESDTTLAGQRIVCFDVQGITVGLAVCYDVRFAGLFQQLRQSGAQLFVIPSAFTRPTGQAHWHSLLRARAIEHQVFVVAAAQGGIHANGRETYGHSLIIDPWGTVLAQREQEGPGWVHASFAQQQLSQIRCQMPVFEHNRFTCGLDKP